MFSHTSPSLEPSPRIDGIRTLLLAAGMSKRFWPLKEKSLFPLLGRPLLVHQMERLSAGGCKDVSFVVRDHNETDIAGISPKTPRVRQTLDLGMQGALLAALPACGDSPVMIVGGNDVIDPAAYGALRKAAAKKGVDGAILAFKVNHYFPGGYLTMDGGRVTGIQEKPGAGKEPSRFVNIVAHVHNDPRALMKMLEKVHSTRDDGYEVALSKLLAEKHYEAVEYSGVWQPVKFSWHLLPLTSVLLSEIKKESIHKSASVHRSAVIEGPVVIEEGVWVLPHATIIGPAHIGRGTIIGNNALVRGASIGSHCVIGYNTEVKSSLLSHHVWTHSSYVGDSVVGANVSFGAGTVMGNLRLDEGEIHSAVGDDKVGTGLTKFGTIIGDDVRIGIHTAILPGVKIGSQTFISSSTLVGKDVPEKSFVSMEGANMLVRPNKTAPPKPETRDAYRKAAKLHA